MEILDRIVAARTALRVGGVPEGLDALLVAGLARHRRMRAPVLLHVARDDVRAAQFAEQLAFFDPELEIRRLPAWDCLPYDRASPRPDISAERLATLHRILVRHGASDDGSREKRAVPPLVVVTTANALIQRLPPPEFLKDRVWHLTRGGEAPREALLAFLARTGYRAVGQVQEPGEFAHRGGLVDVFVAGAEHPVRLDFFGDEIDAIRVFDPASQRSIDRRGSLTLLPVAEYPLDAESIRRFRQGYVECFGAVTESDPLYEAISEGRVFPGAEHWLPLFHARLASLFDYLENVRITLDHDIVPVLEQRWEEIVGRHAARRERLTAASSGAGGFEAGPYKPLPPERLYLPADECVGTLAGRGPVEWVPFALPEEPGNANAGGRRGRDFAAERATRGRNVYDDFAAWLKEETPRRRVLIASFGEGARERLRSVLADHDAPPVVAVESRAEAQALPPGVIGAVVLPLAHGFETDELLFVSEQDVLGERLMRRAGRRRRAGEEIIEALSTLSPGDLVVHAEHGIGRFEGLETIAVQGAPHACARLVYRGGDKLYVPVENIEVLSRYGGEEGGVELDRLGSRAWQARKARMRKRVREIAGELMKVAAERALRRAPVLEVENALYEEFAAGFPWHETEDQARAIRDVLADMRSGRPMDRLVCGDVGFGKTEVALRAAFVAAMSGHQVALVAPTTLLARQHLATFEARFRGFPVRIAQLSRLVAPAEAKRVREGLAKGTIDIVIGTHALLGREVSFRRLGLVVVDEEQHFGVRHKERLKRLRHEVHVLTLTATPIPRTLQLALAGIRDLSLIATPPIDRLAVRSFVTPFDPLVVREALLREHARGGQSFYVAPRISDLAEIERFLAEQLPELRFHVAHGRMRPAEIEARMSDFYEGRVDVLLSTSIIESGLDIPRANTLVVHRADMFGLAQLYQIRGRIGRSRQRGYAYFTLPARRTVTEGARRRLEVLVSLDTLGAGFQLASHDLDIRGAGNLLGEEQSGHIREVGIELYQQMLEEAVAELRSGENGVDAQGAGGGAEDWSPQINVGAAVLIPEDYVPDLDLRMSLYRRLARLGSSEEVVAFAEELVDRFGPPPEEVKQLLEVVEIKLAARTAGIERLDAGDKGLILTFRDGRFANPQALIDWLASGRASARLRPDHRLVIHARSRGAAQRLRLALRFARTLARLAGGGSGA